MKKYFKFMRKKHGFCAEDVVYHVAVGISSRDLCDLVTVKDACERLGYFMQEVSDECDLFITKAHKEAFKGISIFRVNFRHVAISVARLKAMIIADSWAKYESELAINIDLEYFLHANDPVWRLNHKSFVLQRGYSPVRRKYLSHAC